MNPLYNMFNKPQQTSQTPQNGANNPVFNMFGGFNNFQQRFNAFAQMFGRQNRMSPQQKVQELLNSGQMTQEQFNQFRDIANRITGRNM